MRFRNTLVRDAAYEGLPFRRRRELHARVGQAIESTAARPDEEAPALALHFFEARRHDKAWHYGRVAGDRARAVAANCRGGEVLPARTRRGPLRPRRHAARAGGRACRPGHGAPERRPVRPIVRRLPPRDASCWRTTRSSRRACSPTVRGRACAPARGRSRSGRRPPGCVWWKIARSPPQSRRGRWLLALRSEIRMLQGRAREAISLALTRRRRSRTRAGARSARARVRRARRLVPDARRAGEGGARADGDRDLYDARRHPGARHRRGEPRRPGVCRRPVGRGGRPLSPRPGGLPAGRRPAAGGAGRDEPGRAARESGALRGG